jgi:hypothetical protein
VLILPTHAQSSLASRSTGTSTAKPKTSRKAQPEFNKDGAAATVRTDQNFLNK